MLREEKNKILIQIGKEKAIAELLWDEAPNICRRIWDSLPLESEGHHAKICNHELMFMIPLTIERENLKPVTVGDVGWWDVRSLVNIWYDDPGPNGPLAPTALFGRIKSNLEGIAREAAKIWVKPGVKIRMERYNKAQGSSINER